MIIYEWPAKKLGLPDPSTTPLVPVIRHQRGV